MLYFYSFLYLIFYLIPASTSYLNSPITNIELVSYNHFIGLLIATTMPLLSTMLIARPKLKSIQLKDFVMLFLVVLTMLIVSYLCGLWWPVKIGFNITKPWLYIIITILVAINEELFFRVLPYQLLDSKKLAMPLVISSSLFALAHLSYGTSAIVQAFILGAILYLCYFYKKNYLLNLLVHVIFNLSIYFLNSYLL